MSIFFGPCQPIARRAPQTPHRPFACRRGRLRCRAFTTACRSRSTSASSRCCRRRSLPRPSGRVPWTSRSSPSTSPRNRVKAAVLSGLYRWTTSRQRSDSGQASMTSTFRAHRPATAEPSCRDLHSRRRRIGRSTDWSVPPTAQVACGSKEHVVLQVGFWVAGVQQVQPAPNAGAGMHTCRPHAPRTASPGPQWQLPRAVGSIPCGTVHEQHTSPQASQVFIASLRYRVPLPMLAAPSSTASRCAAPRLSFYRAARRRTSPAECRRTGRHRANCEVSGSRAAHPRSRPDRLGERRPAGAPGGPRAFSAGPTQAFTGAPGQRRTAALTPWLHSGWCAVRPCEQHAFGVGPQRDVAAAGTGVKTRTRSVLSSRAGGFSAFGILRPHRSQVNTDTFESGLRGRSRQPPERRRGRTNSRPGRQLGSPIEGGRSWKGKGKVDFLGCRALREALRVGVYRIMDNGDTLSWVNGQIN